jgi:hypothetical protein
VAAPLTAGVGRQALASRTLEVAVRIFELGGSDLRNHPFAQRVVVNFDAVVSMEERHRPLTMNYDHGNMNPAESSWIVELSNGKELSLTEPAFDRMLRAWTST